MGVFHGYQIALELSSFSPLKKKQELRRLITSNDGVISFIVTKKCKLLVTLNNEEKAKDSFKCQTALKYNIPVVESRYVYDCIQTGQLVDPDPYVLLGSTKNQLLNSGVIAAPQGRTNAGKMKKKPVLFNLNGIKFWTPSDKNAPFFPDDDYEVAKSIQLTKQDKRLFFMAEVHVSTVPSDFKFRVFTHSGELPTQTTDPGVEIGKKEYRYSKSADECLAIYSRMCQLQMDASNGFTKTREYLGRNIGSKKFQQSQLELFVNTHGPEEEVSQLVEIIWKEAMGELEDVLSVSIDNITVEQVEKAESVLLELKRLLDESMDVDAKKTKLEKLSDEFYSHLAHSPAHQMPINSKHIISKKQELCQVIRDMVSVGEGTGWSRRCPTEAKYRSLRCHMVSLKETNPDYERIKNFVLTSQKGKSSVAVDSIFEVSRTVEDLAFASKLENKQLLFHSSRVHNFVGILSRGLLLPKVVVDDFGGTRTDAGMLGSGIYFADDASTSAKYSQPSKCKGSRLMLVGEVALGRCLELFEHNTELHGAPEGYDSVHGVKASSDVKSQFKDDEYAIYSTNQQRLRYLVEFRMEMDVVKAPDQLKEETIESLPTFKPFTGKTSAQTVELSDIENIPDPLLNVKAGLVSSSDAPVPLTAVHVKARLIDLAAQVIVLQHYRSEYNAPIEAKYVFPLDEMAAVCGFEAFINDKHIVGEVKEKETAHREYREAISQGHGAYLMDQDVETPDVFTVSVGNLPPFCDVLIKITYVAELQMEGEKVSFRIPACVAPWKKSAGLGTVTQGDLDTVKVTKDEVETSIQVAVEMPFEIKKIDCPTHRIRLKKTDTKAVVEMRKNQPIDEGFQLLISLAEIHVPRMWVEQLPDNPESRACMLTFYPEFEASNLENFEVIFLLDLSNSMKGSSLIEAKKILLLALHLLPESCYFNIIIFGTDYDELFPCSRTRTPVNAKLAENFIKSQEAVMGNTEVIRPLSSLFLVCPEDSVQNLFLVSDGHVSNEQTTLDAIRRNSGRSRIFTFGVGSVANQHTLRSLARAGCGYYEFFNSKMKSRWETKIRNQLAKASQPSLSSICVEWSNFNDAEHPVQAPTEIMALFNGCRQVVYGFVPNCTQATLKAVIDNQEVSTMVSTAELNITSGKILHQLTARAVIQDWNDGQLAAERLEHEILKKNRKNYIIKLSTEFSIITQFTSFVAVEKREKDEVMTSTRNLSELVAKDSVDILDYMGWENVKCRVNVKPINHPSFLLDLDLNDTVGSVKRRIYDVTSDHREVVLSLLDDPEIDDDDNILWDKKIEDGATIYGIFNEDDIERIFKTSGDASQFYELIGKFNDLRFRREEKHSRLESGVELGTKVEAMEKLLEELYTQMKYASDRRPKRARKSAYCEMFEEDSYTGADEIQSATKRASRDRYSESCADIKRSEPATLHSSFQMEHKALDASDIFGVSEACSADALETRSEGMDDEDLLYELNELCGVAQALEPVHIYEYSLLPKKKTQAVSLSGIAQPPESIYLEDDFRLVSKSQKKMATATSIYENTRSEGMDDEDLLIENELYGIAQPLEPVDMEDDFILLSKKKKKRKLSFISHSRLPESIYQEDDFRLVSKREVKEATPICEKSAEAPSIEDVDVVKPKKALGRGIRRHRKILPDDDFVTYCCDGLLDEPLNLLEAPLDYSFSDFKARGGEPLPSRRKQISKRQVLHDSLAVSEPQPSSSASLDGLFSALAPRSNSVAFRSTAATVGFDAPLADGAPALRFAGLSRASAPLADISACGISAGAPPADGAETLRFGGDAQASGMSASLAFGFGAHLVDSTPGSGNLSVGVSSTSVGSQSLVGAPSSGGTIFAKVGSAAGPLDGEIDTPSAVVTSSFDDGTSASVFSGLRSFAEAPPAPAPVHRPPPLFQPMLASEIALPSATSSAPAHEEQRLFSHIDVRKSLGGMQRSSLMSHSKSSGGALRPASKQIQARRAPPPPPPSVMAKGISADESVEISSFLSYVATAPTYTPRGAVYSTTSAAYAPTIPACAPTAPSYVSTTPSYMPTSPSYRPTAPQQLESKAQSSSSRICKSMTSHTTSQSVMWINQGAPPPLPNRSRISPAHLQSSTNSYEQLGIPTMKEVVVQELSSESPLFARQPARPPRQSVAFDRTGGMETQESDLLIQQESAPVKEHSPPVPPRKEHTDQGGELCSSLRKSSIGRRCNYSRKLQMFSSKESHNAIPPSPPPPLLTHSSETSYSSEEMYEDNSSFAPLEASLSGYMRRKSCLRASKKLQCESVRIVCSEKVLPMLVPIPLSVGVETYGRVMTPIFEYNMPLPAMATKYFTTSVDYQTRVRIKVYEGEYPLTKYNHLLGQMELTGIPPRTRGQAKIKAIFNIDVQGTLFVRAVDEATGEFQTLTVTINEEEKSQEDIERMIKDAEKMEVMKPLETADDVQEKSGDNWDICIYDDRTVPDFRKDLFISTVEMNISTGQVSWTENTWEKLINLYTEPAESDEGYWELSDELGQLLCIDIKKCREILVENGLYSLGSQASSDVSRLIATSLVLFQVFDSVAHEDPFPLDTVHLKEQLNGITAGDDEFEDIPEDFCALLANAVRFWQKIDTKHPLLYSRLNLGRSWPEAAVNLLGKNARSCRV